MLPAALLQSLQQLPGFDLPAFVEAHAQPAPVSVRFNTAKWPGAPPQAMQVDQPVPWAANAWYIHKQEPFALDPLWHAGVYYVQEASSMFLEQALAQYRPADSGGLRVLDACAAPGGKSTHLLGLLHGSDVLVSNEVIQGRVGVLQENLTRWGHPQVLVTNNDPEQLGAAAQLFDIIVVDAPCSGSGLFRKDADAIAEWSPANVQLCSQRQQRILAQLWPALKSGGILVYSTCSYSAEEDEALVDFMMEQYGAASLPVAIEPAWGVHTSISPRRRGHGYRFYPNQVMGEGFFMAVLQKADDNGFVYDELPARIAPPQAGKVATAAIQSAYQQPPSDLVYYEHQEKVYAMPPQVWQMFQAMQKRWRIRKAGVLLGEIAHEQLLPDVAWALSLIAPDALPITDLDLQQARQYLRKAELHLPEGKRGWTMARYAGQNLGWFKHLGNRINNYYPTNWRLRL